MNRMTYYIGDKRYDAFCKALEPYEAYLRDWTPREDVNIVKMKRIELTPCVKNGEAWNDIINWVVKSGEYPNIPFTQSGGICKQRQYWNGMNHGYAIELKSNGMELFYMGYDFQVRIVFGFIRTLKSSITGRAAFNMLVEYCLKLGVDIYKYAIENGIDLKETISKPHIKCYVPYDTIDTDGIDNCFHIDINSAYAYYAGKAFPELKPVFEAIYADRKMYKKLYYETGNKEFDQKADDLKAVLNLSIGYMQSKYHIYEGNKAPFANISKEAVDGTYNIIDKIVKTFSEYSAPGVEIDPVLTNTDGVWFRLKGMSIECLMQMIPRFGDELGQFKVDHKNCTMRIKSKGAYEYMEDGKCHVVLRGTCKLDRVKKREDWEWGDLFSEDAEIIQYAVNEDYTINMEVPEDEEEEKI